MEGRDQAERGCNIDVGGLLWRKAKQRARGCRRGARRSTMGWNASKRGLREEGMGSQRGETGRREARKEEGRQVHPRKMETRDN